jgi:hypothetical protein
MNNYDFELKDKDGLVWVRIYISIREENHIGIDIRWALNIDDINGTGHYRCEIINGDITEEVLPFYANYDEIMKWKDSELSQIDIETYKIIKSAYINKKIQPERF